MLFVPKFKQRVDEISKKFVNTSLNVGRKCPQCGHQLVYRFSKITKKQFEIVRKDLEQATKSTHPRKYDLYDIFCAVLYLIKEGCSWRAIPHDFPKWENVRYHYDIWSKEDDNGISLLDKVLRKLVEAERERQGRETNTTMLIIDSKTTQNADTAETKGYDAAKKNQG